VLSIQNVGDKKWKQWSNEDMENAMYAVIDKKSMPLLPAANKHGVPKSTLHDRISGKVKHAWGQTRT